MALFPTIKSRKQDGDKGANSLPAVSEAPFDTDLRDADMRRLKREQLTHLVQKLSTAHGLHEKIEKFKILCPELRAFIVLLHMSPTGAATKVMVMNLMQQMEAALAEQAALQNIPLDTVYWHMRNASADEGKAFIARADAKATTAQLLQQKAFTSSSQFFPSVANEYEEEMTGFGEINTVKKPAA